MFMDHEEREGIRQQALIVGTKAKIIEILPAYKVENDQIKAYIDAVTAYYDLFEVINGQLDDDIAICTDAAHAKIIDQMLTTYATERAKFRKDVETQGSLLYRTNILTQDFKDLVAIYEAYLKDIEFLTEQKAGVTID
jgi:hypothetical protein